ncbi:uncharacterized protein LOC143201478 [Rhynchophorus ferrugineus]|uniref:uncharacterized protein LOC143201478 n=1 Tax=Rhynchophorus ferrugineus TaxID=354439 RepID=UPI003FCDF75C
MISHIIIFQLKDFYRLYRREMKKTSIIPGLLLLLGSVAPGHARYTMYQDESSALQAIVPQSRRTRICTELCMSGLGGASCGDNCYDLIPTNMPLAGTGQTKQEHVTTNNDKKYNVTARQDSCDVLCKNGLGYPLCNCAYDTSTTRYDPDFVQVCSTFCVNYDYQIYGCQNCTLYKEFSSKQTETSSMDDFQEASMNVGSTLGTTLSIGWDSWCLEMCSDGNGGAACNCDLLP